MTNWNGWQSRETAEGDMHDRETSPLLLGIAWGFPLSIPAGLLFLDSVALGLAFAPLLSMIIGHLIAERRKRLADEAAILPESETRH
jgi:hypothetical protein